MCLNVRKNAKKQTAKTDITVYKRLYNCKGKTFTPDKVSNGDEFTGIISGINCSGKIHKNKYGKVWFCTNDPKIDGDRSPVKFGFKYSWAFDSNVLSVIVNKDEKCKGCDYITPYREIGIEIGKTYTSSLIKDGDDEVNHGLHSFESLEDAKRDGHGVYVRCIIPKGSKYYKGDFSCCTSYASDTLKYVEIVE